jgi:hypothetical protein
LATLIQGIGGGVTEFAGAEWVLGGGGGDWVLGGVHTREMGIVSLLSIYYEFIGIKGYLGIDKTR